MMCKSVLAVAMALAVLASGSGVAALEPDAGAAAIQADMLAGAPVAPAGYLLKPDDILQMSVWGEPTIQNQFMTVTPEGIINVPVVGAIQVTGMTVDDLKVEIARRFEEMDYLRNPIVQLTVYQLHKLRVRVLGQVQRPGLQQMRDGEYVDQAIAEAGGFIPDTADLANATITRRGSDDPIPINLDAFYFEGDLSMNLKLQDGDTIYIPEDTTNFFYVTGHVQRPQKYPLKRTTTAMEAVTTAGGASQRGAIGRTTVIRRGVDGQPGERITVDLTKINTTGDTSTDVVLKPGDVVLVPETRKPDVGVAAQIISAFANINWLLRSW